jgi:HEAT repeat protein
LPLNSLEPLLTRLRDPSAHVRESAALELLLLAEREAIEPLRAALKDRDPDVRRTVIQALAGLNASEVLADIFELLNDLEPSVVQAARDAFSKLGQPAATFLCEKLHHPDWLIRRTSLDILQGLKPYCVLTDILPHLKASEWEVREAAVRFLGGLQAGQKSSEPLREDSAIAALITLLREETDREVQMAACRSLGYMEDMRAVGPLLFMLRQSDDESLQMAAAEGLACLGSRVSVILSEQALQDHRPRVRALSAQILGHIRAEHARQPLLNLLHDDNREVRMAASLALSQIEPQEALWVLLYHVFLADPEISPEAIRELGEKQDTRVVSYLLEELARLSTQRWRVEIMMALGEIGAPEIILPLGAYLHAADPVIRAAAIQALGRTGHGLAADCLVACLHEREPEVLTQLMMSLQQLEPERSAWEILRTCLSPDRDERLKAIQALARVLEERFQPFVFNLLAREPDPTVRAEIYTLFRSYPGWLSQSQWLACLRQETLPAVRLAILDALQAVAGLEPELWMPDLIRILEQPDESWRTAVRQLLIQMGVFALPYLLPLLAHESWFVRLTAVHILGQSRDPRVIDPLLQALKDRDRDVSREAALALGNSGHHQALTPLLAALETGFRDVRATAALALGRLGDLSATDDLEIALQEDEAAEVRAACALAIGQLQALPAVGALLQTLAEDSDEWVRQASAQALGEMGQINAVSGLIQALGDPSRETGLAALEALGRLAFPNARDALLEQLEFGTQAFRAAAATALGALRLSETLPFLIEALQDEAHAVRLAALRALGKIVDAQAFEPLLQALRQGTPEQAQVAAEALAEWGLAAVPGLLEQLDSWPESHFIYLLTVLSGCAGRFDDTALLRVWLSLGRECQAQSLSLLGAWRSSASAEALLEVLRRTDEANFQQAIVTQLIRLQATSSFEALLLDWNHDHQLLAVKALTHMGEVGLPVLIAHAETSDETLAMLILQAFMEIKSAQVLPVLYRLFNLVSAAGQTGVQDNASEWLPVLEPMLEPEPAAVGERSGAEPLWAAAPPEVTQTRLRRQQYILQALRYQGAAAAPIFSEILAHPERSLRQMAARALYRLQPEQTLWSTLIQLNSPLPAQRCQAASELRAAVSPASVAPEAVTALCLALEDENSRVRAEVLRALGQLRQSQTRPLLLNAFQDWSHEVREAAVLALIPLAQPDDQPRLAALLTDPDIRVRAAALAGLAHLGELAPLAAAFNDPYPDIRLTALRLSGELQLHACQSALLACLQQATESVLRAQAAASLGQLQATEAVGLLIQALGDPAPEVRHAAAAALGQLACRDAVQPLMQLLYLRDDDLIDIRLQQIAIHSLGQLGDPRPLPELIQMIHYPSWGDHETRRQAMLALAAIAPGEALKLLTELQRQEASDLRRAAEEILGPLRAQLAG